MGEIWRNKSRTPAIAVLLLAAMAVVALLTSHAHYVTVSHRRLAEKVLRDYAALAADEALRRVSAEVGYYGYRVVIDALQTTAPPSPREPPTKAELLTQASDALARSLELVQRTLLFDLENGISMTSNPNGIIDGRLVTAVAALEPEDPSRFETLHLQFGKRHVSIVVASLERNPSILIGFEVDREALARWCATAIERNPLLPPSLAAGGIDNETLYLHLSDGETRELYSSGARYVPGLVVERSLPADYRSIAEGLVARAGIHPDAASRLVIGGLPRSKLPMLLALATLTAGLLVTAGFLLRRERALNKLRSDFVSRVSHELRTPLAQIRMFTETLRLGRIRNEEERQRSLDIMDRESRRLSALVENILQFSRSERNATQLAPRTFELRRLCRRLLREFEALAGPGCRLELDVPADLALEADEDAFRQALLNLLDNAVKYGPKEQRICLGARREGESVRLWVEDEGRGIPPGSTQEVWLPFRRLEDTTEAPVAGTGIGLAIVRDLVEQHGGRCWLERRQPRGLRAVLELPADYQGHHSS